MNNNPQRVAVSVKDSTAKLIMGLLVDVGLPFDYRREPGTTMSAVVSVAQRNGPTLLKVRDVVEDRQGRAQVRSQPLPNNPRPMCPDGYHVTGGRSGFWWAKGPGSAPTDMSDAYFDTRDEAVMSAIDHAAKQGQASYPTWKMPPGYSISRLNTGYYWWKEDYGYGTCCPSSVEAATQAWTHYFDNNAQPA
ncbi:hypothetical protein [Pseudomonas mediterranea]|uniref:hypothetical protein n=1 Tax=Pseudomonas mediterranea TaxID=183795 RepID=UPI0006D8BD17|nr:hypothetical protein [Pseudomonas mediterranea]